MKKLMVIFAMSLVMNVAALKAEVDVNCFDTVKDTENVPVVEDVQLNTDSVIYQFRIRLREMNKVMHLDLEQVEDLKNSNKEMSRQIARLETTPAENRQVKLAEILTDNLATVRDVVDEAQYRAYLSLLNDEFNKTGLNAILYGYVL